MKCLNTLGRSVRYAHILHTPTGSTVARNTVYRSRRSFGATGGPLNTYETDNDLVSLLRSLSSQVAQQKSLTRDVYLNLLRSMALYSERYRSLAFTELGISTLVNDVSIAIINHAALSKVDLGDEGLKLAIKLAEADGNLLLPSILVELASLPKYASTLLPSLSSQLQNKNSSSQLTFLLCELRSRGLSPSSSICKAAIRTACSASQPRLALQLAKVLLSSQNVKSTVDRGILLDMMTASLENNYPEGVEFAWETISKSADIHIPEGLALRLLDFAATRGEPQAAAQLIKLLPEVGIQPNEEHIRPAIEAYMKAGDFSTAFQLVNNLIESGDDNHIGARDAIAAHLQTADEIDKAFYAVEDMRQQGQLIAVEVINSLLAACLRIKDLQRARAIQTAMSELGVTPDVESFNLLLFNCLHHEHRALGDTLLSEMAVAAVQANESTYHAMIRLCLAPAEYEDAFFYLEKMKAEAYKPDLETYQHLLEKCVRMNDRRWRIVLQEMEALGYSTHNARTREIMAAQHTDRTNTVQHAPSSSRRSERETLIHD